MTITQKFGYLFWAVLIAGCIPEQATQTPTTPPVVADTPGDTATPTPPANTPPAPGPEQPAPAPESPAQPAAAAAPVTPPAQPQTVTPEGGLSLNPPATALSVPVGAGESNAPEKPGQAEMSAKGMDTIIEIQKVPDKLEYQIRGSLGLNATLSKANPEESVWRLSGSMTFDREGYAIGDISSFVTELPGPDGKLIPSVLISIPLTVPRFDPNAPKQQITAAFEARIQAGNDAQFAVGFAQPLMRAPVQP